ncbi:ceramide synthase 1 isoform X2 [Hemicordylus capensis]|uniref:ceramide synthase 1 isoform X2 n=1 Tax=Hemicordylus capensis TaxID=884348 RepID=UPI0023026EF8|nr:ceramide synthase 1 isoform X2 [Hemicordylus capensis]
MEAAGGGGGVVVEPMPGYEELVRRSYASLAGALRGCSDCGWERARRAWAESVCLSWGEPLLCLLGALALTLLRRAATRRLFQPFAEWCQLLPKDAAKMPESAWKLAYYMLSWSYSAYLLFFTNYPFFHDPPSVFYDWKRGMEVPLDIAGAYLLQGSFYSHSIYAALYMDAWRKDSVIMLVHHVVTLMLIVFSYMLRYHNVGILVLFLHDISDIQLEFTKLNVYFKYRGGVYHQLNDIISNAGCISFSVSWFWFRLYWFPLKVLYATCHSSLRSVPDIPFYFFFNALLFVLTLMNIYWFLYIILFVAKVFLGEVREVNDVREYDLDDGKKVAVAAKMKDGPTLSSWKEGKHLKNGMVKDKRL